MRGLGILLMVLGHSGFAGTEFIYLFHMALFFMLSGWLYKPEAGASLPGLRRFAEGRVRGLWLPFVLANTFFTLFQNLFLRLGILTNDPRILELPGQITHGPVTVKDIIGRTVHWCLLDGGTQLGGALWFFCVLFVLSLLYAGIDFALHRLWKDTLAAQGVAAALLLGAGWLCQRRGFHLWNLEITASCYILFWLGAALRRLDLQTLTKPQWAAAGAAAFAGLLLLGRFGGVGLAANAYPNPLFLVAASLLGWILVKAAALLSEAVPVLETALRVLGRHTVPIAVFHFLAFKAVTAAGLAGTGGDWYRLAAFPTLFTGGAWWLAYTAAGLCLPLAGALLWQRVKRHG